MVRKIRSLVSVPVIVLLLSTVCLLCLFLIDKGGCYHLDKCQIFNTYGQIPPFHLCNSLPLHPSPFSLAVSSLLLLLPPSLHPSSFLSLMGLFARQKVTEMSLLHTHSHSLGLSPPFFFFFLKPSHSFAVSHMTMHKLLNVSPFLSLLSPHTLSSFLSL